MRNRRRSPVSFASMSIHPEKGIARCGGRRVNGVIKRIILPGNAPGKQNICLQ